jgi:hypothetical protein
MVMLMFAPAIAAASGRNPVDAGVASAKMLVSRRGLLLLLAGVLITKIGWVLPFGDHLVFGADSTLIVHAVTQAAASVLFAVVIVPLYRLPSAPAHLNSKH